jgi:hypothetical protein
MTSTDDRLTAGSLERYFGAGVPTQHVLCEQPNILLRIEPHAERLVLRTPHDGTMPSMRGLRHVEVDAIDHEDGTWSVVRIDARDMHYEAYGLTIAVAEAMRGGASFAAATNAAMTNLRSLLAARARMSESQQLGLAGELLVLDSLLDTSGNDALGWWLGPTSEQHDFAFPGYDVEVKTTLSERRRHMISGVDQLRPNPGRPLWLLSIQVTRAGGADGFSLAGLVADLRARVAGDDRFMVALASLGWRDTDADLYDTTYLLRTTPRAYAVDDDFPALTSERLRASVPHPDLVSDVAYRVDVTDRSAGMPGHPVDPFLDPKGPTA